MTSREIARYRLTNQLIAGSTCTSPSEVVTAMGAVQAQDYLGSLWAVGLRARNVTERDVEQAIEDRKIVRTWPMRGTLQFIAPDDVRWMLESLGPRMIASAARRHRELELDASVFARSEKLFARALEGGKQLTRPEIMGLLERARISTSKQRGYHILWRHALGGLICCGPREGKQQTFVLLDEWLPRVRRRARDQALADFALRYFTSHGPATVADFAWWLGIKKSDATAALDSISPQLSRFTSNGSTYWMRESALTPRDRPGDLYLLPSFDELLIGYTDRSDALASDHAGKINPSMNGLIRPLIVKAGRVIGTWKRTLKKGMVSLDHHAFTSFGKSDLRAWTAAAKRYAKFLGVN
jgi:hypothetical protein